MSTTRTRVQRLEERNGDGERGAFYWLNCDEDGDGIWRELRSDEPFDERRITPRDTVLRFVRVTDPHKPRERCL